MSGKGDKRRPTAVSGSVSKANWDRIFGGQKRTETYYICAFCMAEDITQLPPDAIDYCDSCEVIVEGNTIKCERELDE